MTRTPDQAVEWASVPRAGYGGMCLKFVRDAYAVPSEFSCARDAYYGAEYPHPLFWGSNVEAEVPYGAPLFMDKASSTYGHVAVYAGNGRMCTTDSQSTYTRVDSVQSWINAGYHLLGWTEDLNGVRVIPCGDDTEGDEDMPLNQADKDWITGEVHRIMLEILRAPEFKLTASARKEQTQSWTLAAKVSDDTGTLQQTTRDTRRIVAGIRDTLADS